ncbi:MAG: hypothetical protein KDK91_32115, partial [Gammaproteobacteria bacterium]|nr:hypothetical protein [Gammaproteobacteria bacterium]
MAFRAFSGSGRLRLPILAPLAAAFVAALQSSAPQARETDLSILDAQQRRETRQVELSSAGDVAQRLTLLNLNPRINTWFVLEYPDRQGASRFHLENADPQTNTLSLAEDGPAQLVVTRDGRQIRCDVSPAVLDQARRGGAPYASLCNDTVFLRNPTRGRQTSLEKVTDFLRDHAWGGEEVIGLVKTTVMKDAFLEEGEAGVKSAAASGRETDGPRSALLAAKSQEQTVRAGTLAIEAVGTKTGFQLGQWYPMRHLEGAWLSLARPGAVAQE